MVRFTLALRQGVRALKGLTFERGRLDDDDFSETSYLESVRDDRAAWCFYEIRRVVTAYLFRDFVEASAHAEAAYRLGNFVRGFIASVDLNVFSSLTFAAIASGLPPEHRADLMAKIRDNQRALGAWLPGCPTNFRCKYLLVEAELARIEGRDSEAADSYEGAIDAAAQARFLHEEALARELAARHALGRGRSRVAELHMREARRKYAEWGATEKVRALDEEFPLLRALFPADTGAAGAAGAAGLDLVSVLRVAGTLSTEPELDLLLQQLLRACIEAAGAERAVLVLEEEGAPYVRASGTLSSSVLEHTPLRSARSVPVGLVEQVRETRRALMVDDALRDPRVAGLEYFRDNVARSILVVPVQGKAALVAVLYCENGLATHAFSPARVNVIGLLSAQMAGALQNGLLFEKLRAEVSERTRAEQRVRFLADAGALLAESLDYEATLVHLAHLAVPALADWCVIDVVAGDGTTRRVGGAHADSRKAAIFARLQGCSVDLDAAGGVRGVLRSGEPMLIDELDEANIDAFGRDVANARLVRELDTRSAVIVPLALDASESAEGNWDRLRVEQIVFNLLSNAVKFGDGKPIEVRVAHSDEHAVLTVRDHGLGIPPTGSPTFSGGSSGPCLRATSVGSA